MFVLKLSGIQMHLKTYIKLQKDLNKSYNLKGPIYVCIFIHSEHE